MAPEDVLQNQLAAEVGEPEQCESTERPVDRGAPAPAEFRASREQDAEDDPRTARQHGLVQQVLREQVVDMREKMRTALDQSSNTQFDLKQGKGGIADIEFMVQYSVLRWAHEYPELLNWTDNIRLLNSLAEADLLHDSRAELLANTYRVFRAIYHRNALQELPGLVAVENLVEERKIVAEIWDDLMLTQVVTGE